MPVNSITYQPATGQLIAAYRPIVIKVSATATGGGNLPPYVVCDIYIENIYYKSILRTAAENTYSTYSVFQFDISDAVKQYLQPDLVTINNNDLLQAPHMSGKVFCRFRSSDIDANGFTIEEPTVPKQGTKNVSPVAGTGTQSNTFFAINSALQHEDNQNLQIHLDEYKSGPWAGNAYPLTHRKKYYFCDKDSDHFPLIYTGDCLNVDIKLNYRLKGQTTFQRVTAVSTNSCTGIPFEPTVTGNRVDVHLDTAPPSGQSVLVQYKKQADSVWINAGTFTAQDFHFNVNGDNVAGDYDIRVVRFCTPCQSSDPVTSTFTLDGTTVNLAWRGITPFCVQQTLPQTIYVQLEVRNSATNDEFFPDNVNPISKTTITSGDLYAKFFSDANFLNPLTVTQTGLKIYVKSKAVNTYNQNTGTSNNEEESVATYTKDVSGTEVLLGTVNTEVDTTNYNPYPTIESSQTTAVTFSPYPTSTLVGGNTGDKGYTTLQQYNTDTGLPTGVTKPNDSGDPDYIAPAQDTTACPNGPDITTVTYGYGMQIYGVQLHSVFPIADWNAPAVSNTSGGGWSYCFPIPKNINIYISVRARTLDIGNTTGHVKCRVSYIDAGGNFQTGVFDVPNNIDTSLPAFNNITNVNISNY